MDANTINRAQRLAEKKKRKRKRWKLNRRANNKLKLENVDPTNKHLEISNNGKGCITAEMGTFLAVNSTAQSLSQEQSKVDTVSTEIPVEKSAVDQLTVNTVSAEILEEKSASSKKKKRKLRRKAKNKDELQNVDQTNKCLEISRNGKSCITAEMGTFLDVNSTAQPLSQVQLKVDTVSTEILEEKSGMDQLKEDTVSTEILVENSSTKKKKRRKLKRRATNKDELENVDPTDQCLEISNNGEGCITAEICTFLAVNSTAQSLPQMQSKVDRGTTEIPVEKSPVNQPKVHTVSAEILEEKSASSKKKRRKLKRRAKNKDELENVDPTKKCLEICNNGQNCTTAEMGSFLDVNLAALSLSQEQLKVDTVSTENLMEKSAMEQPKVDAVSVEIPVEKSAIGKKKIRGLRGRANNKDELEIVDPTNKCLEISDNGKCCNIAEMGAFFDRNSTTQSPSQDQLEVDIVSAENVVDKSATRKRKRKKRKMKKKVHNIDGCPSMDQGDTFSNLSLLNECNGQVTCSENSSDKCRSQIECPSEQTSSAITAEYLSKHSCLLPKTATITHSRKILLILDLNGLLADIVTPPPRGHKADRCVMRRAIFKRPYCDDFLKFCFETFDVGIWSSRSKKVIVNVVAYLLKDLKHKLLFCWDMSHTTKTKFKTLDNKHKLLVCKELRKLWEARSPKLPWEKGDYDESNTLLIDDSPYKALLNPIGTAIFPHSYSFKDQSDNALGPGGDLRLYLQDLAKTDNVQKYVEQHPFGQSAINDKSPDWIFYSEVLQSLRQLSA